MKKYRFIIIGEDGKRKGTTILGKFCALLVMIVTSLLGYLLLLWLC